MLLTNARKTRCICRNSLTKSPTTSEKPAWSLPIHYMTAEIPSSTTRHGTSSRVMSDVVKGTTQCSYSPYSRQVSWGKTGNGKPV